MAFWGFLYFIFLSKYYDGKTSQEAEKSKDKKLNKTEEAENEKGRMLTTEEAGEDKKLSTIQEVGNETDKDIATTEVAGKEKDKVLSAIEEDIGDTDSLFDGSLYDSEENTYDLSDSFIDDCELSMQPSVQELLGVEVNQMMLENEKPKNRISSSKGLKRNQSTESDGDARSKLKQRTTKNSSSGVDGGPDYNCGFGGGNRSKQKRRTAKNSSSGVDGGADFKRGSGGTLGRGEKDKFYHLTISGETESGVDANSDLKIHEHYWKDMKSQRRKRIKKENLSGGIVIDELAKGKPDGEVATRGRKVKIIYTAWIKETGKVIESNSGRAPFKFRLGDEEIIKAWNVGVEGMQVGDKRRIILPPSLGSWRAEESAIPSNSRLVYDIELVGVR